MNLPKLTLIIGAAIAVLAFPIASANAQRGGGARGGSHFAGSAPQANFAGSSVGRAGIAHSNGAAFQRGSHGRGTASPGWQGHGNRRWHGTGNHRWYRRGYYPYYAYDPFYYGFGFGYGYGYPYYGTSAYYNGYPGAYSANVPAQGSVAVAVQQELAREGFYRGPIDGVIGSGTRAAIRSYERANRLPIGGRIDGRLLDAMGIG